MVTRASLTNRSKKERKMIETIGKCAYCKDPIYDFQKVEVEGSIIPLHKGCLAIVAEKVEPLKKDEK